MAASTLPNQVVYYKRYRMEMDLLGALPAVPALLDGYRWIAWADAFIDSHAEVKYRCFRDEMDGVIFPNLSDRVGCAKLMREIRGRPGFLPEATWLIAFGDAHIGTVQGISDGKGSGGIQNLGVIPEHRSKGLGLALLLQALNGFRRVGLCRATLEVTARNEAAIRMYRRLGFRFRKSIYKVVEPIYRLASSDATEWML